MDSPILHTQTKLWTLHTTLNRPSHSPNSRQLIDPSAPITHDTWWIIPFPLHTRHSIDPSHSPYTCHFIDPSNPQSQQVVDLPFSFHTTLDGSSHSHETQNVVNKPTPFTHDTWWILPISLHTTINRFSHSSYTRHLMDPPHCVVFYCSSRTSVLIL